MSGKEIIDKAIAESGGIWKPSCAIVNDASNPGYSNFSLSLWTSLWTSKCFLSVKSIPHLLHLYILVIINPEISLHIRVSY